MLIRRLKETWVYRRCSILIIFSLLIIVKNFTSVALSEDILKASPFNYFVIGGWVGPHQTKEQYYLYKKAGFNTVLEYLWEGDDYTQTLVLVQKVEGLKAILNIDQKFIRHNMETEDVLFEKVKGFIMEVKDEKNQVGYFLYDEPERHNISLIVKTAEHILQIDRRKFIWMNFYVEKDFSIARTVLNKLIPSAISMDFYPFEVSKNRMNEYYCYIDWFRTLSLEYDVPFWTFVQSAEWFDRIGDKRLPNSGELRLLVYTNLAYGAKGLWYYTYVSPRHSKSIKTAILDKNDKPTKLYEIVKNLNREVSALAPILMKLKSMEVVHTGIPPKGLSKFKPNNLISGISGDNIIIGYFQSGNGSKYIMLVNKLTNNYKNVTLELGQDVKSLLLIDKQTGEECKVNLMNKKYEICLQAGDGMLFKILQ